MTDGTQRAPEVTPDLRLRAERPRVTRLSRKVLIGLGGAVGLARRRGADLRAADTACAIKRPKSSTPPRTAPRPRA